MAKRSVNGDVLQPRKSAFWQLGLYESMKDPELLIHEDDDMVVIRDKYPKATVHLLILPKKSLKTIKDLTRDHVALLNKMEERAKEVAGQQAVLKHMADARFRYGYHAIASMNQLHLHAISQDFDSPCLKNKKHWNSFTTDYFINSKDVIKLLQRDGRFVNERDNPVSLLSTPLKCHKCHLPMKNMPFLKCHIKNCNS